jgi:hypothetical protein
VEVNTAGQSNELMQLLNLVVKALHIVELPRRRYTALIAQDSHGGVLPDTFG